MRPEEYLKNRLRNCTKHTLSEEEQKNIKYEGIETFIFRKLKSKRFRKTKIDEEAETTIKNAIHTNVEKGDPIKFTYPFGGYKIWRVPGYPEVEWAEFFSLTYVCDYVSPILSAYEPGVEFYFSSDDIVMELTDNFPRIELDKYVESFRKLIDEIARYFPVNMSMSLNRTVPDYYTREEYDEEFKQLYEEFKKKEYTDEQLKKAQEKMVFHFQTKGQKDYSKISKTGLKKLWRDLMYWSDAYLALTKRTAFIRGQDKIVLFSNAIPKAIDIGSTQTSKAKFWAGIGILEIEGDKTYDRILSPKQFEEVKDSLSKERLNVLPGKNFESIYTFNKRLNFLTK